MPRDMAAEERARIGPNAILQYLPVLDAEIGQAGRADMLARLGIAVPDGSTMVPEAPAASLHRAVRDECGARAAGMAARAGRLTGAYILAHRIPAPAQAALRAMPARLAAKALSRAIAQHAWTFAGSGRFTVRSPWSFAIADNPLIGDETAPEPLCHWHAAVFETLYRRLVHHSARCRETACSAAGASTCCFEIAHG
jgi:divinyl protochlorophyllide a 8-vinyl-reductase